MPLSRQGSAVALVRADGRLVALVANRAGHRLDIVDVAQKKAFAPIPLAGEPAAILALADGRVLAALIDRSELQVVRVGEPAAKEQLVDTPRGPSGLAASEDGARIVVAATHASEVAIFDAAKLEKERVVAVPRSPKGVVIEGDRAFVSHVVGDDLSVIDLTRTGKPRAIGMQVVGATQVATEEALERTRHVSQSYALTSVTVPRSTERRIFVPQVSVDPGDDDRAPIYYGPPPTTGIPKATPVVMSIDAAAEKARFHEVLALSSQGPDQLCILPRGVAARDSSSRLYVACRGLDSLLELDATVPDPMRTVIRTFPLSKGTTGVAVADEEGIAVSYGEFDDKLDIVALGSGERVSVDLSAGLPELSSEFREGRELFYATGNHQISFDGVGCATCHPDGGDDALTWNTPEGLRQTPMLAGRLAGTEPYGWSRNQTTVSGYIETTTSRLGGSGLSAADRVAMATYLDEMAAPQVATTTSHGLETFNRAGCGQCHVSGVGVDKASHNFDPHAEDTPGMDTPSLRYIGLTAPYFHDGRYRTLEQLLGDRSSKMGNTARLSPAEQRVLAEYLRSL